MEYWSLFSWKMSWWELWIVRKRSLKQKALSSYFGQNEITKILNFFVKLLIRSICKMLSLVWHWTPHGQSSRSFTSKTLVRTSMFAIFFLRCIFEESESIASFMSNIEVVMRQLASHSDTTFSEKAIIARSWTHYLQDIRICCLHGIQYQIHPRHWTLWF
jgi:hypothetical protein